MRIVKASVCLESPIDGESVLKHIERCGRLCYKSEGRITEQSAREFVKMIIKSGHESVIEHFSVSFRLICDRGVSHEIVRHRIASYSQESTRYCNYSEDKFGSELTFISPSFWVADSTEYKIWVQHMEACETAYFKLIGTSARPEEARSVLPNSLKTEIIMTMNLRELRHFLHLRTSKKAHPQMREIALEMLDIVKSRIPVVFDDIIT